MPGRRKDCLRSRLRETRPPLQVDRLESRCLLHGFDAATVVLNGNILEITADKHPNLIDVSKNASDKIVVQIDGQTDPSNPAGYDVAAIQQIRIDGGPGNDQIDVNGNVSIPCLILGGKGNDTITGGAGNDTVDGGVGGDWIDGGDGDDSLLGGTKNDTLHGSNDDDIINGGKGNDSLDGGSGEDIIQNDLGRDSSTGGSGGDLFAPLGKSGFRSDFDALEDIDGGTAVTPGNFTDAGLRGTRTDLQSGAPDVTDRHHTTANINYAALGYSNPPSYGPHHARLATKNDHGAPVQPTGSYLSEIDDADLVHNLEHGHVWLSYDPGLLSAADIAKLQAVVSTFGATHQGIALTPRAANDQPIALVSWAHLQTLSGFDLDEIAKFIITNRGHAPEGFITP